ncbi:MAG: hypothetical protein KatS3mg131_0037 [Candidatus Tectimicrobiota bacterium]|nr:MAG: hypothetical protein KatS3mg131_0037 [Candidatus Tectomicrobia bacterium]
MTSPLAALFAELTHRPPAGTAVASALVAPPHAAPRQALPATFPPWLRAALHAQGITQLAAHQAQALALLHRGTPVCLAAPAGSGRGVLRLLALLLACAGQAAAHALLVVPDALQGQRQLATLLAWNERLPPEVCLAASLLGGEDKPPQALPPLVLATPQGLHACLLAGHARWPAFFAGLRCVVVSDVHAYGGAPGAHLAHLLQRLQRLACHYGGQPHVLLTTAPLANAAHVARTLLGAPCALVAGEPVERQAQHRLLLQAGGDPLAVCRQLLDRHRELGVPLLLQGPATLGPALERLGLPLLALPAGASREAYHAAEQRLLQRQAVALFLPHEVPLAALRPLAVPSLGCLGLPDSLLRLHEDLAALASSGLPTLSTLVVQDATPLERYLLRYPEVYQDAWPQELVLAPAHPQVFQQHRHCALAELPPGPPQQAQKRPPPRFSLAHYEPPVEVVDSATGRPLAQLTAAQAFRAGFPGAVLLTREGPVRVEAASARRLRVRPAPAAPPTRSVVRATVTERQPVARQHCGAGWLAYGTLHYAETLVAYEHRLPARRSLHPLPARSRTLLTRGVWLELPEALPSHRAALHAVLHALLLVLPLALVGTEVRGGLFTEPSGEKRLLLADATAGGNGSAAAVYGARTRLLRLALQLLHLCDCPHGCPRCLEAVACDACSSGLPLPRREGAALLERLLGEVVPPLASVATPPSEPEPAFLYLCLSTQRRADEVGGWQHAHRLGLGVAVTYDARDGQYRCYTEETVAALIASLRQAECVVGANPRDFDYRVLQPYTDFSLATLPTLALLEEAARCLGFRPALGRLVAATLGIERPEDGRAAVAWLRAGETARVVQRCRRDLELLRALVEYGRRTGTLRCDDRRGQPLVLPVPW